MQVRGMKVVTIWDSGPYSRTVPVADDDPEGREITDQLWADYRAAEERYEKLKDQVEAGAR